MPSYALSAGPIHNRVSLVATYGSKKAGHNHQIKPDQQVNNYPAAISDLIDVI